MVSLAQQWNYSSRYSAHKFFELKIHASMPEFNQYVQGISSFVLLKKSKFGKVNICEKGDCSSTGRWI
jgi:hypothetical protein